MRIGALVFFLVPLIEMIILIEVGGMIGALPTVLLVVLTAVVGVWLLRLEGMATLMRVQEKLNQGEVPGTELLEGVMLLIGGALLLTPGFATDAFGFVCLIPGLRRPLAKRIISTAGFQSIHVGGFSRGFHQHQGPFNSDAGTTIDGEFFSHGDAHGGNPNEPKELTSNNDRRNDNS